MKHASNSKWSRGPFRAELQYTLEFVGPLHVGTGEALSLATDAPALRDAAGRVWLPGSSIRGVLADWCHREAPLLDVARGSVQRLFGLTPRRRGGSGKNDRQTSNDRQGRLTVLDVELEQGTEQIRDHVRIDRRWGAAARGGKFDHEVAHPPTGTLRLIYEGDSRQDSELVLLQSAADALQEGLLAFGGKTGWGLGAARVGTTNGSGSLAWCLIDRKDTTMLSAYLRERLPPRPAQDATLDIPDPSAATSARPEPRRQVANVTTPSSRLRQSGEPRPWSWLRLSLRLAFDGPMLVAALDTQSRRPAAGRGSRTGAAAGIPVAALDTESRRPAADATYQVDPQRKPVLAGSALRGPLRSDAERIAKTLDLDGLAQTLFGTENAQGLIRVGEGVLEGEPNPVVLNHVSIDRVTGFAAKNRLFDAEALSSPCFRSDLVVRWHADEESHRQAVALLFFLLRDAEQEGLWIGSRTTRGYGHARQVTIVKARWSLVDHPNATPPANDAPPPRRAETREAPTPITVATLATCLGFVQQAWTTVCPRPGADASRRSAPEGAGSASAD